MASNQAAALRGADVATQWKNRLIFAVCYIALFVVANILSGGAFFGRVNMISVLSHAVYYGMVGFGMAFVMTAGIVDMSMGANVLLSANVGAFCAMNLGLGYVGLVVGAVICAAVLELFTVFIGLRLQIPSWIAGLSMALLYEGMLTLYSNYLSATQGTAAIFMDGFNALGRMPGVVIVWLVAFVVCYYIYNFTTIGINIRALGCNGSVAQAMGIRRNRTLLIGAVICGIFLGLGAVVLMSMNKRVVALAGMNSISQIFKSLATFLLASSFSRIIGVPVGLLLASLFIAVLFNFMTLMGVPSGTGQEIMLGAIVILCGVISMLNHKGVVK